MPSEYPGDYGEFDSDDRWYSSEGASVRRSETIRSVSSNTSASSVFSSKFLSLPSPITFSLPFSSQDLLCLAHKRLDSSRYSQIILFIHYVFHRIHCTSSSLDFQFAQQIPAASLVLVRHVLPLLPALSLLHCGHHFVWTRVWHGNGDQVVAGVLHINCGIYHYHWTVESEHSVFFNNFVNAYFEFSQFACQHHDGQLQTTNSNLSRFCCWQCCWRLSQEELTIKIWMSSKRNQCLKSTRNSRCVHNHCVLNSFADKSFLYF